MNEQEFHPGSVPVAVVARIYGKDASWVRAGIVSGIQHLSIFFSIKEFAKSADNLRPSLSNLD